MSGTDGECYADEFEGSIFDRDVCFPAKIERYLKLVCLDDWACPFWNEIVDEALKNCNKYHGTHAQVRVLGRVVSVGNMKMKHGELNLSGNMLAVIGKTENDKFVYIEVMAGEALRAYVDSETDGSCVDVQRLLKAVEGKVFREVDCQTENDGVARRNRHANGPEVLSIAVGLSIFDYFFDRILNNEITNKKFRYRNIQCMFRIAFSDDENACAQSLEGPPGAMLMWNSLVNSKRSIKLLKLVGKENNVGCGCDDVDCKRFAVCVNCLGCECWVKFQEQVHNEMKCSFCKRTMSEVCMLNLTHADKPTVMGYNLPKEKFSKWIKTVNKFFNIQTPKKKKKEEKKEGPELIDMDALNAAFYHQHRDNEKTDDFPIDETFGSPQPKKKNTPKTNCNDETYPTRQPNRGTVHVPAPGTDGTVLPNNFTQRNTSTDTAHDTDMTQPTNNDIHNNCYRSTHSKYSTEHPENKKRKETHAQPNKRDSPKKSPDILSDMSYDNDDTYSDHPVVEFLGEVTRATEPEVIDDSQENMDKRWCELSSNLNHSMPPGKKGEKWAVFLFGYMVFGVRLAHREQIQRAFINTFKPPEPSGLFCNICNRYFDSQQHFDAHKNWDPCNTFRKPELLNTPRFWAQTPLHKCCSIHFIKPNYYNILIKGAERHGERQLNILNPMVTPDIPNWGGYGHPDRGDAIFETSRTLKNICETVNYDIVRVLCAYHVKKLITPTSAKNKDYRSDAHDFHKKIVFIDAPFFLTWDRWDADLRQQVDDMDVPQQIDENQKEDTTKTQETNGFIL